MKRYLKAFYLMSLVCSLLLVSACGGGADPGKGSDGGAGQGGEKEKITLDFWTIALQPNFTDYFNKLIADYESKNPNVKINWQDYPMDAIQTKLLATSAGKDAPDVVNLNTEIASQMATKGALADLKQYLSEDTQKAYFEGIFNATVFDGKAYALPWYTSTQVLFMNKGLLEKAGLDPANAPKSRDELHDMARKIKAATGAAGYATEFTAKSYLANEGVPILNEDRSAAAFNSPEGIQVIEDAKKLIDEGVIVKEIAKFDAQVQFYASEQVAFVLSGPTFINRIKTAAEDIYKNTVAVSLPPGKGNLVFSNSMNMVVPKGSSHPQEAADFAAFITNAENQLSFAKEANTLPSTKATIEDKFFTESDNSLEAQAKIASVQGLKLAEEYALGVPSVKDINDAIAAELQKIFLDGADVKASLDEAAKQVNDLISSQK